MSLKLLSLKRISFAIAKYIAITKKENHEQRYLYYYSLQIVIGTILETSTIILISWIFGFLAEALICSAVFTSIRFFAGGYHADTYTKCFIFTIILMTITPLSSQIIVNYYIINIHLIIFAIVFFLTYKYAPCDTINKPISTVSHIQKLRIQSILLVAFWFTISMILIIMNKYINLLSVIGLAALLEAISITPWVASKAPLRQKNCAKTAH